MLETLGSENLIPSRKNKRKGRVLAEFRALGGSQHSQIGRVTVDEQERCRRYISYEAASHSLLRYSLSTHLLEMYVNVPRKLLRSI